MSISDDLFMAILAMDSYNRGYAPGLVLPASATSQIGNALLAANSSVLGLGSDGQPIDEAAGFFAQAYTLSNGQTVISYRGTDNRSLSNLNSDVWTGRPISDLSVRHETRPALLPSRASRRAGCRRA